MVFSQEQKVFIIESYFRNGRKIDGIWKYSIEECFIEFQNQFPGVVEYKIFQSAVQRCVNVFRETGSVTRKEGSGRPKKRTEELKENVQQIMENAPRTSVRVLSQMVGVSVGTCHTVLKKDLRLFSYRLTCQQELHEVDFPRRAVFCEWFLNNYGELHNITFFSDEAWFHLSGYVNSQNMRMWSSEKPDNFFVEGPLHAQKIGVWCALNRRRIYGPIFFNGTLTAQRYREEIIAPFVNQLEENEITNFYFQQDGARAHTAGETMNMLREVFQNRLISLNAEHEFPPRSCDITPCDFFLWPYLKNNIFELPIPDLNHLQARLIDKIREINNTPSILENVFNSLRNRCEKCLEQGGGHFQQLL